MPACSPVNSPATTVNDSAWPQFFGADGTGVVRSSGNAPVRWSREANETSLRWRTELPGSGWSSPVVDQGIVFVSAAIESGEGQPRDLVVHKVDAETGRLLATFKVFKQADDRKFPIHGKNSHASATMVLDGQRLFAHFGYQGTALLTTDGEIVWENRDLVFPPVHGNGGSPIMVGDQLVFTCDGADEPYVASLESSSGKLRWKTTRPVDADRKFSFATPSAFEFEGQAQIIAPGSDCIMALDPADGRMLWSFESSGFSVVPKPMKVGELIIYCTGFMRPSLIAIRPGTEANGWVPSEAWRVDRNVPKTPTPILDGDAVVMVSDEGIVTRVRVEDGSVAYRKRLGGKFSASPIKVNELLYLTSEDGTTTVIRSGENFEEVTKNELDERTFATPAFAYGSLFIRTEQALYCIAGQ